MSISNIKYVIVVLIFFVIGWRMYGDVIRKFKIIDVPYSVKCYFGEQGCEKGDIDGETLCRGILFLIIGLLIPNNYFHIIVITSIMTVIEPMFGYDTKFIINPLVSVTGYAIGSLLISQNNKYIIN